MLVHRHALISGMHGLLLKTEDFGCLDEDVAGGGDGGDDDEKRCGRTISAPYRPQAAVPAVVDAGAASA